MMEEEEQVIWKQRANNNFLTYVRETNYSYVTKTL